MKYWKLIEKGIVGLVIIGLIFSAYFAGKRYVAEKNYKDLEVAVEYGEVIKTANLTGMSVEDILRGYKEAGITSVFIKELSFADYKNKIWFSTGAEINARGLAGDTNLSYIGTNDENIAKKITDNLSLRGYKADSIYDNGVYYVGTNINLNSSWLLPEEDVLAINTIGLGWPVEDMKTAEKLGLNLQLQIKDWQPLTEESVGQYFNQLQGFNNISLILFDSSDIFGFSKTAMKYKQNIGLVAEEISKIGAPVGQIEFYKQQGFNKIVSKLDNNVVRLHSISAKEQATMSPVATIDRFMLAAKDRNMRSLLVRQMYSGDKLETYENNLLNIGELTNSLKAGGFTLGKAVTLPDAGVGRLPMLIMCMAVLAAYLALSKTFGLEKLGVGLFILGVLGVAGLLYLGKILLVKKMFALAAVIVFPLLAMNKYLIEEERSLPEALKAFVMMTFFSLCGALMMVGILYDKTFMLALDIFAGVKIAHLVPLVLILALIILRDGKDKLADNIKKFLDMPITMKVLAVLGVLGIILLIYISRTGNNSLTTSALELKFRNILEGFFGARPRTKEFLIGHPLMLLLLVLGVNIKKTPLLVVAAIGQISIVNTFAHIHTPIMMSFLRSIYGMILGMIIGIVLVILYRIGKKQFSNLLAMLKNQQD